MSSPSVYATTPRPSAAKQSRRCGSSPNDPSRVSATMRETCFRSRKIRNGRRILRFMGCRAWALRCCVPLPRLADCADHVQGALRIILEFIGKNSLAAIERVAQAHQLALDARKLLGRKEGLRKKPLKTAGAGPRLTVLRRELFETQHRDHVLELLVLSQGAADMLRHRIVPVADNAGGGRLGTGLQQIDRGIQPFACPFAR